MIPFSVLPLTNQHKVLSAVYSALTSALIPVYNPNNPKPKPLSISDALLTATTATNSSAAYTTLSVPEWLDYVEHTVSSIQTYMDAHLKTLELDPELPTHAPCTTPKGSTGTDKYDFGF